MYVTTPRMSGTRRRTRLAIRHDCGIAAVEDAFHELLRRVRVDMILRRRLVEDHIKFEGLLVVGRLESELVLGAGRGALRAVREGSHADCYSHAFARRRGAGVRLVRGRGGRRRGRRGGVLRTLLQFSSHFAFEASSRAAARPLAYW